jgi:hypothetical protein
MNLCSNANIFIVVGPISKTTSRLNVYLLSIFLFYFFSTNDYGNKHTPKIANKTQYFHRT